VVEQIGAGVGERSAVLVASRGLVPPLGTTPSAFVAERVRARAVAALAGPACAREALEPGAAVVVAARNGDLLRQLGEVLGAGGLSVRTTDDVAGAELAACANDAAALASATAADRGASLAGAAAGGVFSEVRELALANGGRSETFAGLAAGEPAGTGLAAESRATVPLLDAAFEREGIEAPVTGGLRRLLDGDSSAEQWLESVRASGQGRRRQAA
jgi:glycerol-3-phosphate dehydrogenase